MKRLFDALVAAAGLLLLSPLLLCAGLAVVVFDGWPVFFFQERIGRRGRPFRIVKFCSMRAPVDGRSHDFDLGNQSRVTRLGRFLRTTKIDELPQLWNVLKGEMSLVGPRPEVRRWTEVYPERWAVVHSVRPGITDPASILYRHEEEILSASADPEKTYRVEILPRKLELYEGYVRSHSFSGDMRLLCATFLAVIKTKP